MLDALKMGSYVSVHFLQMYLQPQNLHLSSRQKTEMHTRNLNTKYVLTGITPFYIKAFGNSWI